jgi:hypothetical protein
VWRDLNRRFAGQLVTWDLVRKVTAYHEGGEWKQNHPGWLTFNDLWSSKQQIIALTNDADKLQRASSNVVYEGETYILPGSVLRSFSADTNNPKILLDSLDKNVNLIYDDLDPRLSYLGTQMTPKAEDFVNPVALIAGVLHPLARISTSLILERLANSWRGKRLNIVAGDYINEFGFCEAVIKHNGVARD